MVLSNTGSLSALLVLVVSFGPCDFLGLYQYHWCGTSTLGTIEHKLVDLWGYLSRESLGWQQ